MVAEGQYLERATVIPGAAGALEGLFHRGDRRPGVVIAPPMPDVGGSMEGSVVAELAWAITRSGLPTLRFNYRGVGASEGRFDPRTALEDLRAAEEQLRATLEVPAPTDLRGDEGRIPLGLCGVGGGADLVLRRAAEGPGTLIAVAVAPVAPPPVAASGAGGDAEGEWIAVFPQSLADRAEPWRLAAEAHGRGRVVIIPRADPGFVRGLVDLGRVVAQALSSAEGPEIEG